MIIQSSVPVFSQINTKTNYQNIHFTSNPNSPLLKFSSNDFFVNIKGYGKNRDWVYYIKQTADKAVGLMRAEKNSDEVLQNIALGTKQANGFCRDINKRRHTGILRTERRGYGKTGEWRNTDLYTPVMAQYVSYTNKLKTVSKHPLKSPYPDIDLSVIETGNFIDYDMRIFHPAGGKVNNALDRIGGKYFNLKKDYIAKPENVTDEKLPQINSDIAEIRWLMAHSMPWERGSDSISNVFMRALYKSMGIKTYPLKQGVSLDLEAFCTPLSTYKKEFSTYFEKMPHTVE